MEIISLNNLAFNGITYNLHVNTIINDLSIPTYSFECTEKHEMRMDLIAFDLYGNTDNIDVLCSLNSIKNIFSIKKYDNIFYVEKDDIDKLRSSDNVTNALIDSIKKANKGKEFKPSKGRDTDVNNRRDTENAKNYIPPNITKGTNFDTSNGSITIGPNF